MKRYAVVRGLGVTADKVAAYLPNNYKVIWSGKTDWHYSTLDWHYSTPSNTWKQYSHLLDDVVLICGEDSQGWTLDKYVMPRLASGMMQVDECDLSHPIMKEIIV